MNGSFGNDTDPRADLTLGQRIFHLGMLLRRAEFGLHSVGVVTDPTHSRGRGGCLLSWLCVVPLPSVNSPTSWVFDRNLSGKYWVNSNPQA